MRILPLALILIISAVVCAADVPVADLTGIWAGTTTNRDGEPQDVSFRFVQKGEALSGKMYGDNESLPIVSGTVSGGEITFTVSNGANGQGSKIVFSGTVVGPEQVELVRGRPTASGDKGAPPPPPPPQIHLKKLA